MRTTIGPVKVDANIRVAGFVVPDRRVLGVALGLGYVRAEDHDEWIHIVRHGRVTLLRNSIDVFVCSAASIPIMFPGNVFTFADITNGGRGIDIGKNGTARVEFFDLPNDPWKPVKPFDVWIHLFCEWRADVGNIQ